MRRHRPERTLMFVSLWFVLWRSLVRAIPGCRPLGFDHIWGVRPDMSGFNRMWAVSAKCGQVSTDHGEALAETWGNIVQTWIAPEHTYGGLQGVPKHRSAPLRSWRHLWVRKPEARMPGASVAQGDVRDGVLHVCMFISPHGPTSYTRSDPVRSASFPRSVVSGLRPAMGGRLFLLSTCSDRKTRV